MVVMEIQSQPTDIEVYGDDGWRSPSIKDNGTMPVNVEELARSVIGHKIVSAEKREIDPDDFGVNHYWFGGTTALVLTLDDGRRVAVLNTNDCCAHTTLESFVFNADRIDHAITGVRTSDGYTKWHIMAEYGDVLEMEVGWSCGNPFYYSYGFEILVSDVLEGSVVDNQRELQ